jgi:hypothetical protein
LPADEAAFDCLENKAIAASLDPSLLQREAEVAARSAVVALCGRFDDGRWPRFSKRSVARCSRREMKSVVYSVMAAV